MLTRALILTLVTLTSVAAASWAFEEVTSPLSIAESPGWDLLTSVEIEEIGQDDTWSVRKTFPPELVAAAPDFRIEGYLVPIFAEPEISNFILVQDPQDCPFCGSSGYGPVLEVVMKRALPDMPQFTILALKGTLELVEDPATTQAYRLVDAQLIGDG